MNLEELVQAAGVDRKTALLKQGIADSLLLLTGFPTFARRLNDDAGERNEFFYQMGYSTTNKIAPFLMFGAVALQPRMFWPILGTNLFSWSYEIWRKHYRGKSILSLEPSLTSVEKNLPQPEIHRTFIRKARSWILGYALAGALALTHYTASTLFKRDEFREKEVNVELQECHLERAEKEAATLYLLGEQHQYNYSSSFFIEKFLEQRPIDAMLVESSSHGGGFFDMVLAAGHFIISKGNGFKYPTPSDMAWQRNIPYFTIESSNSLGTRAGMSKVESILFNSLFTVAVTAMAPSLYFVAVPQRYINDDGQTLLVFQSLFKNTGILQGREEAMGRRIISITERYRFNCPLVRVGRAHLSGIQQQLQKYGELHCRSIPNGEIF